METAHNHLVRELKGKRELICNLYAKLQFEKQIDTRIRRYERVVVVSKVPLPNYRLDLDDEKPLREAAIAISELDGKMVIFDYFDDFWVSIPFDLQIEVDSLLGDHLQRKQSTKDVSLGPAFFRSSRSDIFGADYSLDQ